MYPSLLFLSAFASEAIHAGCTPAETTSAGRDADGNDLSIVKLQCGTVDACDKEEYWLLTGSGERSKRKQLLVETCTNGYGQEPSGIDEVTIGENTFAHTRMGGTNLKWAIGFRLQLSPLEILETSGGSVHQYTGVSSGGTWHLRNFEGIENWAFPKCQSDDSTADPLTEVRSVTLPQVPTDASFEAVTLGSCSVEIDSTGKGFLLQGEPGAREDARMRAVMVAPNELWVDVHDDVIVPGGDDWRLSDHLQLWSAPPIDGTWCYEKDDGLRQWAVRLSDASVFSGHGSPEKVTAKRIPVDGGARLKIVFPEPPSRLTLAYSDTDNGTSQERLFATSSLVEGNPLTVGTLRVIAPQTAVCATVGGSLNAVNRQDPRRFISENPVIQSQ